MGIVNVAETADPIAFAADLRQECQNYVNIRRTEANQALATLKQQTPTQIQPGLWSPDQPIRFGP